MALFSLILYGIINGSMVGWYLRKKGEFCNFPFWMGVISMGWFFPQALGGVRNLDAFPEGAYESGMLFASLCSAAAWISYATTVRRVAAPNWLDAPMDLKRLYTAGAFLCLAGFFFQYKLMTLPEEMLDATQWSGAAVKYLFLASIFKFGFLALWLIYISQKKWMSPKLLILLVPCMMLLLQVSVLRGRRAEMMNLAAYLMVTPWFVRRWTLPRGLFIGGLMFGLVLINSIGVYRSIMDKDDLTLKERLAEAASADYTTESKGVMEESGVEFKNYLFFRYIHADQGFYDFGIKHWNGLIFNYVPAQLVGRTVKKSLQVPIKFNTMEIARTDYGHKFGVGTTLPGYTDAFASFWWLGFLKFSIIGWMMGVLYRHAMSGAFLAQLLYVYSLGTAMHSVTHGTHSILFSIWVYFFALGYPAFHWARAVRKYS